MSKTPPIRSTWFRFYGQRYLLGGSLRAETLPDERGVWLDFLCMANAGDGHFDSTNKDALAAQLLISRELLDRAIKKFIETKRLSVQYDEDERKDIFTIVKWPYYQAPMRKHKKTGESEAAPADHLPPPPPSKKEIKKYRKIDRALTTIPPPKIAKKGSKSGAEKRPLPDIPKDLSFKVMDDLRDMKAKIRELERLALNERGRQMAGFTEGELKARIEKARKEYVQAIEDRA